MNGLVERLRDMSQWLWTTNQELRRNELAREAADRIEALEADALRALQPGQQP